jgi:glyoxylase-like metal-dependent hydrolase (beta-lactamase superfamily II)
MSDPFNRDANAVYGKAVRIAPQLRRITAPNASPMTFTGTQTYLAGDKNVVVIDPGPADEGHIQTILSALGPKERIVGILVTHTHIDHSPGAAPLAKATGAPVFAFGEHGTGMSEAMTKLAATGADMGGGEGADRKFRPTMTVKDGDAIKFPGLSFTVLHTPGHLSNHVCFDAGDGVVFTGDLVMGWATTMVSPPDGDMAAFLASLRKMQSRGDRLYYPGHGEPVRNVAENLDYQISHRKLRDAQIRQVLKDGPATPAELTAKIYTNVDKALHPAAARNVFAHLLGMLSGGLAEVDGALSPRAPFAITTKGRQGEQKMTPKRSA